MFHTESSSNPAPPKSVRLHIPERVESLFNLPAILVDSRSMELIQHSELRSFCDQPASETLPVFFVIGGGPSFPRSPIELTKSGQLHRMLDASEATLLQCAHRSARLLEKVERYERLTCPNTSKQATLPTGPPNDPTQRSGRSSQLYRPEHPHTEARQFVDP